MIRFYCLLFLLFGALTGLCYALDIATLGGLCAGFTIFAGLMIFEQSRPRSDGGKGNV